MPRASSMVTASASVGQRAGSTGYLVKSLESLHLAKAIAKRLLPVPVVNLMPVACRNACGPHGDEQVVGYRQTLRWGEPAGPRCVARPHPVAAQLFKQLPTLLQDWSVWRFYDCSHRSSIPRVAP